MVSVMVMVSIVGILSAIAVPNFIKFQQRSKIAQVKAPTEEMVQQVRNHTTDYIVEFREIPSTLPMIQLPNDLSNEAFEGVAITDEYFILTLSPDLGLKAGAAIVLTPYIEEGMLYWTCEDSTVPTEYLPPSCES